MKNKRVLTLLLLFVMSFQVVHALAIDMLDTHKCQVNEYVSEFTQAVHVDEPNDICNMHSAFHLSFLIPTNLELIQTDKVQELPFSKLVSYDYDGTQTFLIPPRNI
ncbi:hypothetical protein JHD47_00570 [Sulfurimonas sp. SAG-AH-194-L11]|nr:hypothetical protein [Sulfurimonas sp. SAG-AH-194-L11]MDF1876307.1 hypothetical protein [Sulfurimonas sp. SAG-AH-194-L11]